MMGPDGRSRDGTGSLEQTLAHETIALKIDYRSNVTELQVISPFRINGRQVLNLHGMEEVVGSIPTRSTKFSTACRYTTFQLG
jgi:hypothetical protein